MKIAFQITLISTCLIWLTHCQYHAQYRQPQPQGQPLHIQPPFRPQFLAELQAESKVAPRPVYQAPDPEANKPRTPRPLILTHRQEQEHNGGFKYAFSADNGLQQGESIAPDGTRTGGYSYVDPHGKTITVKYTAGKEGFRILEGEHVPRTPEGILVGSGAAPALVQQRQYADPAPIRPVLQPAQNSRYYSGGPLTFTGGSLAQNGYNEPRSLGLSQAATLPKYLQYKSQNNDETAVRENTVQAEPEYNDEPGKANSFGVGYAFHFGTQ